MWKIIEKIFQSRFHRWHYYIDEFEIKHRCCSKCWLDQLNEHGRWIDYWDPGKQNVGR